MVYKHNVGPSEDCYEGGFIISYGVVEFMIMLVQLRLQLYFIRNSKVGLTIIVKGYNCQRSACFRIIHRISCESDSTRGMCFSKNEVS